MSQFNYKWPTELGVETEIPSFALFSVEQVVFGAIKDRNLPQSSEQKKAVKQADIASIGKDVANDFANNVKSAFNFNTEVDNPNVFADRGSSKIMANVALPLPDTFFANTNVAYSESNAGGVQAALIGAAGDAPVSEVFELSVKGIMSDLVRTLKPVGTAIAATSGKVVNPFAFQVFSSVGTRKFSYTWNMTARNEAESQAIKDICDIFQFAMLPKRDNDQAIHFLEIPYQFDVKYYYENSLAKFYDQPQKCYLESVNITYGGDSGNQQFSDGSPVSVNLALTFSEIQPMFRNADINGTSSYGGERLLDGKRSIVQSKRGHPSGGAA